MNAKLINRDFIKTHLGLLYGRACEERGFYFSIFSLPSKAARFFNEVEAAIDWCADQTISGENVYCGMGMFEKPIPEGRGLADDVRAITCLWSDIDILDPAAHKKKEYPRNIDEVLSIAKVAGLSPSFYNLSGYGTHCNWLLTEPLYIDTPEQRKDASVLVSRWNGTIKANAKAVGRDIDSVHDLARVLRVAGTINFKAGGERPVTMVVPASIKTYNIEDLEPYLIASEYVNPVAEILGVVGQFNINPGVVASPVLITTFCANNTELADTWNMKRPDFKDQSPSTFEMSLVNSFVKIGYDDQTIVDLLVFWRRTVAHSPKNRVDYYQRTIGKARAKIQSADALRAFDQPGDMPQTANPEMLTQSDRTQLLNMVRGALLIDVERFIQLNSDNAEYFVELKNGDHFSLGQVSSITRFHVFRDRILERCNVMLPSDRAERWPRIVQAMFAIVERQDGDEPRHEDRAKNLLTDYLDSVKVYGEEEWQQALQEDYPFVRDGKVWVNKRHFIRWSTVNRNVKFTETEVERDFHLLNLERQRHEGTVRGRTRRPWFWGTAQDDFANVLTVGKRPKSDPP